MYNSVLHKKAVVRAKRPTKGHISHPKSLVDDFNVRDLVKYYKIQEANEAVESGKPAPKPPGKPFGSPLSSVADYKAHQNYVGHESNALAKKEFRPPPRPTIQTDAKGRKVLVDHTGKITFLEGEADSEEEGEGFPVSEVTGVRYMSYDPMIDDPDHEEYQDEWVSTFGKLKAAARRRHAREIKLEKLGYDPKQAKQDSRRYKGKRGRKARLAKPKGFPGAKAKQRGASPLRTASAASGTGQRRRPARKQVVSQYNQHRLRPAEAKAPIALAPFIDADTGEALVPNTTPVQSPRAYQEAARLAKAAPVVIDSIGDLEAVKRQHEDALLALIGHEWRRERQRMMAYNNEPFEFRKKWLARRMNAEREEARKHIQQVRHDSEFVLAERMAAHGLLK